MSNLKEKMIAWCEKEIAKRKAITSKSAPYCNAQSRRAQYQIDILEETLKQLKKGD